MPGQSVKDELLMIDDLATPTVVVVNDDPVQLMTLKGLVQMTGLKAVGYGDAEAALAGMASADERPVLIVTDVYMPQIDGWRFCRLLRSEAYSDYNTIPILVVSATFAGDEPTRIAADLGAEAFLPCPVDGKEFIETIWKLIEGRTIQSLPRVLIVEDDVPLGHALVEQFTCHGYRPVHASTFTDAIALFKPDTFALALIDEQLPDGKGRELLSRFHALDSGCALVTMSGMSDPAMYLEWMKRGASASLHKPFDMAYMLEVCAKARRERALLRVEHLLELRTCELQRREREYRSLVEGVPDVVIRFDRLGKCLFVSENVTSFLGAAPPHWLGRHFADCGLQEDVCGIWQTSIDDVFKAGTPTETEFCIRGEEGGERYYNWRLLPEFQEGSPTQTGRVKTVLTFARDITHRKEAEEERQKLQTQLVQAQKMETVGRLAGGVAHDFNNMLGVILGNAELAMDLIETGDPLFDNLKEVRNAAVRSSDITRQLLAFSRKQSVAPVVLDLNEQVESVLKMLRRLMDADVAIQWTPGSSLGYVRIDPCQIDQVLVNLCVNARDALEGRSGQIRIRTDNETFDRAFCDDHPGSKPGAYVRLQVRDNGEGMAADVIEHVFEPFFTTKGVGQGTGLGLATVYGIVKQNNGYIALSSEAGKGTCFDVYLPRVAEAEERAQASRLDDVSLVAAGHGETILVVEDESSILSLSKLLLERNSYHVIAANSPADALQLAREHDGPIHLLITDVIMPDMNGKVLATELSRLNRDLKCLFMSGYTADVISRQGVLDEGVHFLQKPFSGHDLLVKVQFILTEGTPITQLCPPEDDTVCQKPDDVESLPVTVAENVEPMPVTQSSEGHHARLARHLQYQHRMESVAELARSIAHDCNNLIMVIQWYAEQALESVDVDHPCRPWLGKITTAAKASADLTRKMLSRQMLEFAGKQSGTPIILGVNQVLKEAGRFLVGLVGSSARFSLDLAPESWPIYLDPWQFDQILANVCLNARDALPAQTGEITIETENVSIDVVPHDAHGHCEPGDYLCLRIRDNGEGMNDEVLGRVFEPFFTTKTDEGGGIGLPTVLGIVKQNKGWIRIDSQLNAGTCVEVFFPRYQDHSRVPADASAKETM